MMLLLVGDVLKDPGQVALAEADYSVSAPPAQCIGTQFLIRVKRSGKPAEAGWEAPRLPVSTS